MKGEEGVSEGRLGGGVSRGVVASRTLKSSAEDEPSGTFYERQKKEKAAGPPSFHCDSDLWLNSLPPPFSSLFSSNIHPFLSLKVISEPALPTAGGS